MPLLRLSLLDPNLQRFLATRSNLVQVGAKWLPPLGRSSSTQLAQFPGQQVRSGRQASAEGGVVPTGHSPLRPSRLVSSHYPRQSSNSNRFRPRSTTPASAKSQSPRGAATHMSNACSACIHGVSTVEERASFLPICIARTCWGCGIM